MSKNEPKEAKRGQKWAKWGQKCVKLAKNEL